jgi:hypothetical protein
MPRSVKDPVAPTPAMLVKNPTKMPIPLVLLDENGKRLDSITIHPSNMPVKINAKFAPALTAPSARALRRLA